MAADGPSPGAPGVAAAPAIGQARVDRKDFHAAIAANRRRSFWLLGGLAGIAALLGGLAAEALAPGAWPLGAGAMLAASGLASLWALWRGDRMALGAAGARPIDRQEAPVLHNVVEEMAIAAGLPMPAVAVVETAVPNAFAAGLSPERATIAVTRGLLERLSRDELQAVVAHETAHVLNGDMRQATIAAATAGLIALVAEGVLRMMRGASLAGGGRRRGGGTAVLMVVLVVAAILAPLAARLVQMAVSRQREYLADATAVKLTRNPQGLIGALEKLSAAVETGDPLPGGSAIKPLWMVAPPGLIGLFATHPPMADRLARLRAMA
ncbi:MAG: hypothetical protein OHK0024_25950 [Thalassobaculales bacterium]